MRIYHILFVFCSATSLIAQPGEQPNILFILADDVGQEVLGCYGGASYFTPNLDELARTGMQFRHAYSMPNCFPTRLTLLTGKYPLRHGALTWGHFPKQEEPFTFSNILRENGYRTGIAGKWQLTLLKDDPQHPKRLGFDHSDLFGWHEGARYYDPLIYQNGKVRHDTKGHYGPDLYLESLINFMRENRENPFLAYYPMALCHDVTDDLREPVPHGFFDRYDNFAEMVGEMDRIVGRLVAALNILGLREKTLIIFIGDNGTPQEMIVRADDHILVKEPIVSIQNGKFVPGGKSTLLDGGTRVPMLVNWQGVIQPGQIVDDLVDFSDFYPTFLDLAGIPIPGDQNLDGSSFADRILKAHATDRKWVYAEAFSLPKPGGVEPSEPASGLKWIRNRDWKWYNNGDLFDMTKDPKERHPIRSEYDSDTSKVIRIELEKIYKAKFGE